MSETTETTMIFPPLNAEDLLVKIGQATEKGVELILYKNGVIDSILMDQQFGPLGWKKKYKTKYREDGTHEGICTVSVYNSELGVWVSKDGVGEPTARNPEKGLETDAMKRACYQWGIGRELKNHVPKIIFPLDKCKYKQEDGETPYGTKLYIIYDTFTVDKIEYSNMDNVNRRIIYLEIRNTITGYKFTYDIRDAWNTRESSNQATSEEAPAGNKKPRKTSNKTNAAKPVLKKKAEVNETKVTETEENVPAAEMKETESVPVLSTSDSNTTEPETKAESTVLETDLLKTDDTSEEEIVEFKDDASTDHYTGASVNEPSSNDSEQLAFEFNPAEESEKSGSTQDENPWENDPLSCPVSIGKWDKLGSRVGDLKPNEVRYVYMNPKSPQHLKDCCKEFAKMNKAVYNEFIAKGINPHAK